MKKTIIATALLGLFSSSILGVVANAEVFPHERDTDATIQFNVNEDDAGHVIKPNPDKENPEDHDYITPEGGASSKGPLRIQFVPDFEFGIKKGLSSNVVSAYAKPLEYKATPAGDVPEGVDNSHTKDGRMTPFVQISDFRGLSDDAFAATKGWDLTVSASKFIAPTDTLETAVIYLKESTLTTTTGDSTKAGELVSGFAVDSEQADLGLIPLTGAGSLNVLSAKGTADTNTNGHQISNVFGKEYKKTDEPAADADIAGIKFVKPAGQTPQKDTTYTARLTWTLTDAK